MPFLPPLGFLVPFAIVNRFIHKYNSFNYMKYLFPIILVIYVATDMFFTQRKIARLEREIDAIIQLDVQFQKTSSVMAETVKTQATNIDGVIEVLKNHSTSIDIIIDHLAHAKRTSYPPRMYQ
jgi:enoyl-[acyl-carrier-protein] reductase (NADH)